MYLDDSCVFVLFYWFVYDVVAYDIGYVWLFIILCVVLFTL